MNTRGEKNAKGYGVRPECMPVGATVGRTVAIIKTVLFPCSSARHHQCTAAAATTKDALVRVVVPHDAVLEALKPFDELLSLRSSSVLEVV